MMTLINTLSDAHVLALALALDIITCALALAMIRVVTRATPPVMRPRAYVRRSPMRP